MNRIRYGNKSVIAEILPDDQMPYTDDGRTIDIELNLLAIVNRTTSMPLTEIFLTGAAYQLRQHIKDKPLRTQEALLFKFLKILNPKQEKKFHEDYKALDTEGRRAYIKDAIDNAVYINEIPMWEDEPVFYRCLKLKEEFPFIKDNDVFVRRWGREHKVLTKYFIGNMYVMRLKQSDRRGFSARSTGAMDTKSLPTRSFKSRSHLERISTTCVRFGEYETYNFSIGIIPMDMVLFHALYRTSIKGRKDLVNLMFSDYDDPKRMEKIDGSYTSRVAEIFNVILKSLGIRLEFIDDANDILRAINDDVISDHKINGKTYFCTDYQALLIERIDEIKEEILSERPVLTKAELLDAIEEELRERTYINGPLKDEISEMDKFIDLD